MINEIIQNISNKAITTVNRNGDKESLRNFIYQLLDKEMEKYEELELIKSFDKISDDIVVEDVDPMDFSISMSGSVNKFLIRLKKLILRGYIAGSVLRCINVESKSFSVN